MKQKILLGILLLAISHQLSAQTNSFEGVWKIVKVIYVSQSGTEENTNLLPSQIIFTKSRYSFLQYPRLEMQKNYSGGWRPSDQEKIESYNSIIVNGGKFKVENSILILMPEIAKTPNFVGGFAKYVFEFQDESLYLTLIDLQSNNKVQDTAALSVKTTFVLRRIE